MTSMKKFLRKKSFSNFEICRKGRKTLFSLINVMKKLIPLKNVETSSSFKKMISLGTTSLFWFCIRPRKTFRFHESLRTYTKYNFLCNYIFSSIKHFLFKYPSCSCYSFPLILDAYNCENT